MIKKLCSVALAMLLAVSVAVPAAALQAKKIRMASGDVIMLVGASRQMSVRFTPADADDQLLRWSSHDPEIASVDDTGLVTAIKRGSTLIVARSSNGLSTSCRVTVREDGQEIRARGLELSVSSMTVRVDQTRALWALFTPNDTTDQDVVWSSSDNDVATVDIEGTVTGIAPGTATITAESANGQTATCTVTVPGKVVKGLQREVEVSQAVGGGEKLTSAAVRTAVEETARLTTKGTAGTATFADKSSISPTVMGAAAFSATSAGRDIRLKFTTTNSDSKVQGALTLDPQAGKELAGDIQTGVFTQSQKAQTVAKRFERYFLNQTAVLHCTHPGAFGLPVELAVKTDFSPGAALYFYSYNSANNHYEALAVDSWSLGTNGSLRFQTSTGGVIVVSDGALAAK